MSKVTVEIKGKEDVSVAAKKARGGLDDLNAGTGDLLKAFGGAAVAGAAVTAAIRQIAQTVDECIKIGRASCRERV